MSRYVAARKRDVELAKTIDACFKPAPTLAASPLKPAKKGRKDPGVAGMVDVILEAPRAETSSIFLRVDNKPLLMAGKLPRNVRYRFKCESAHGKALALRLELGNRTYNLSLPCSLAGRSEMRIVQWAENAPPRVMLDGVQINRGAGVHLVQVAQPPELPSRQYEVPLTQADLDMLDHAEPVNIYVDDQLVTQMKGSIRNGSRVLHVAKLGMGLHRVVVVSRRRGWVIADTDIVINGTGTPRVVWHKPNLSDATVSVDFGKHEFRGPRAAGFIESTTTIMYDIHGLTIGGIQIPDGIEMEDLAWAREVAQAMVANYRLFMEIWHRANWKKYVTHEEMTPEEAEVYAIDHWRDVHAWIMRRKRMEGYSLAPSSETNPMGESTYTGPEPQDALDELLRRVALGIHEPSHVEAWKRRARERRLNWDQLVFYLRTALKLQDMVDQGMSDAEIRQALTQAEIDVLDWGETREASIMLYLRELTTVLGIAEEEIQEYEAELRFYDELIAKLQEEFMLVPTRELWNGAMYLHGIRDSFRNLSEDEKERLRARLRRLRRSAQTSQELSDEQKAHLMMLIDEALAALG